MNTILVLSHVLRVRLCEGPLHPCLHLRNFFPPRRSTAPQFSTSFPRIKKTRVGLRAPIRDEVVVAAPLVVVLGGGAGVRHVHGPTHQGRGGGASPAKGRGDQAGQEAEEEEDASAAAPAGGPSLEVGAASQGAQEASACCRRRRRQRGAAPAPEEAGAEAQDEGPQKEEGGAQAFAPVGRHPHHQGFVGGAPGQDRRRPVPHYGSRQAGQQQDRG